MLVNYSESLYALAADERLLAIEFANELVIVAILGNPTTLALPLHHREIGCRRHVHP
jgi:hypothetical protein